MTITEDRDLDAFADYVEDLVPIAARLIGAVHDDGLPGIRDVLASLPPGAHLDDLCVVLAAMADPDRTPRQSLEWLHTLGVRSRDRGPRNLAREHGTPLGYRQHVRYGDMPACGPCLRAKAADSARYRESASARAQRRTA